MEQIMKNYRSLFFIFIFGFITVLAAQQTLSTSGEDNTQRTIDDLKEKIVTNPNDAELFNELGYLYLEAEKWSHAVTTFKKCIALSDTFTQAMNGLGKAYHEKGESAFIPVEKIKKLFKIDNYSKAERQFEKALKLRPEYLDPLYNMGVNYLAKTGKKNHEKAVGTLNDVLDRDSTYKDVDLVLGIAYQHIQEYDKAEKVLLAAIANNRWISKANLRLSDIYLEMDENEKAIKTYYEGVTSLRDEELLSDIYAELKVLMTTLERHEFEDLSSEDQGNFIRKLWKRKDPTPTTEENERFVEHFERKRFALENFPDIIPPYYDDRGKVYVKYGSPDARHIGKLSMQGIKENESWAYEESIRKGLTFDFVKKGHTYREVNDLGEAAPPGVDISSIEGVRSEVYGERYGFTESYDRFALVGPEGINQTMFADFQANRMEANRDAPAESFDFKLPGEQLSFVYNLAQFKSSDGKARTEVYLGIPNNNLNFISGSAGMMTTLDLKFVAQDTEYVKTYNRKKTLSLFANNEEEIKNRLYIHQENINLNPGKYQLALRIDNPQGNARGVYQNEINVYNFYENRMMMSDVQLATNIVPAEEQSDFVKSNLKIIPYPYTVIRRQKPIFIYFEVYNLSFNAMGKTDYTVHYTVELIEKKRGLLSKTVGAIGRLFSRKDKVRVATTYQQSSENSSNTEYFSMDMSKLTEGAAQLSIQITDNVSSEIDKREIHLQIIE